MKRIQDISVAWDELRSGNAIDSYQSEAYLDVALRNWLLAPEPPTGDTKIALTHLAKFLELSHGDSWLTEFLEAPFSTRGNHLLLNALRQNYAGDAQEAYGLAGQARKEFARLGNSPGVEWSAFEQIYSLGRQAHSAACLKELSRTMPGARHRWLRIQWAIEHSICSGVAGDFDSAQLWAGKSRRYAMFSKYPQLLLRATALEGAWHNNEGRFLQGWSANELSLESFWNSNYPAERAFQFYSDLALATEKTRQWHLSGSLQREALSMLTETKRVDFTAIAHFHTGLAAQNTGDSDQAREEYRRSKEIFETLPPSRVTRYYEAEAEIGLVDLELRTGSLPTARAHLQRIGSAIATSSSHSVSLRYEKVWAHLEQASRNKDEETLHLARSIAIGDEGYTQLRSEKARWEWDNEVGEAYRRLVEINVLRVGDPAQNLADWETYRLKQNVGKGQRPVFSGPHTTTRELVLLRGKNLKDSALLTFAVFEETTVVWVLTNQGVREIRIPVSSNTLQKAVDRFHSLCADPNSSLTKVNLSGLRLYQWLIYPLEEDIKDKRTVFVEADTFLSQVPWPALVNEAGAYLGQRFRIVLTPGLLYSERRVRKRRYLGSALFANPAAVTLGPEQYPSLPEAAEEEEQIRRLYPAATFLSGGQVNAGRILQELKQANFFEFAGHARSRQYGGELIIHGENGGDVLSASRLGELNLSKTDLVVLSACSTALSQGDTPRDPNGLVRAFLRSGVHSVIASTWDVDSGATFQLMTQFHQAFHREADAALALREGQAAVFRSGKQHPYYWAAFELFGDID